jgi:aminoglycoside phosphotransferase (APT) family kinase protein
MNAWRPEVVVDADTARRLIGQFAEIELDTLRLLADGWDRAAWLVNEKWVFGFPRRAAAVPGIEREIQVLPRLSPMLPLPIPVPVFVGRPVDAYPWPFFGSAFLPGQEACDVALDDARRVEAGLELAAFLRRLHSGEVAEALGAADLPLDPNRRGEVTHRVEIARRYLDEVERLGLWRPPRSVVRLLATAERLRLRREPPVAVVHGDLHFRHFLFSGGRLGGVIDWVDLCRADPAVDLQFVWSFLPPAGRDAFVRAYGSPSDEQLMCARVLALSLSAALACYANEAGLRTVEREAVAGLERAAVD